MEEVLIISLIFLIAFFIESIFGFGGLVLSFTVLSFFMETKEMITLGLYIAAIGSLWIIFTDLKSFNKKIFWNFFKISIWGILIGVYLFSITNSSIILNIFAIFLLIFSLNNIFNQYKILEKVKEKVNNVMIFTGGLMQGIYGTGGPFTVLAVKNKFKNKRELRVTMAYFFLVANVIRAAQLEYYDDFNSSIILEYWWLGFLILIPIWIGYKFHLKINNKIFNKILNILILISAIILLIK